MYVLAIDTSSSSLSAAIADEQGVVGEFGLHTGRQHSEALLPLLESLLQAAGLRLAEMDALGVTVGPGSFTGLRIGLATAKAWVQALDKPLIAVSTLEALALTAAEAATLVCPVLDARRDELYTALFEDGRRLTEDQALAPLALAEQLAAYQRPVLLAGDGIASSADLMRGVLGERLRLAPEPRRLFLAAQAALITRRELLAGNLAEAVSLEPRYLRLSEPEEKRLAAQRAAGDATAGETL